MIKFALGFLAGLITGYIIRTGKQGPTAIITGVSVSGISIKGEITNMELKEGFRVDLTAGGFRTARGNPAAIEAGSARWSSSDESVVSVEQDPADETKATIRGLDGSANESVVVEFRADGDTGEGISELVATLAVVCTQGNAVVADISAGTPVEDTGAGEGSGGITAGTPEPDTDGGDVPTPTPTSETATSIGSYPKDPGTDPLADDDAEKADAPGETATPGSDNFDDNNPAENVNGVETGQPLDGGHTENRPNDGPDKADDGGTN